MRQRATLTICETCGYDAEAPKAERPGARLADLFEAANPSDIAITRTQCLMACDRACAVALQSAQKYSYVVCELPVDSCTVNDLISFARYYAASDDGTVAWKHWPDSVKGRFAARIPWLEATHEEASDP